MRVLHAFALLAGSCGLVCLTGCNSTSASASAVAPPQNRAIVGPIPGNNAPPPFPTNPYALNSQARADGRRLFNAYNCSGCHGDHAGGGMGPSLRDESWIYGGRDANIFASIAEGRANGMPAWGVKLPDEDMWKLTAYIRSMRTADEPEPPQ